ncbi:MAG: tRNA pseudouridine(38-40) synthase TruA [Halobacteriota archaeon]
MRADRVIVVFAFRLAYDGRGYHGFQRQPDVSTVEGSLLEALAALDVLERPTEVPPGYAAAGRTDAGVSAIRQTVAFEAPEWLEPRVLSRALPEDIHAWARAAVPPTFHATHDAVYRRYTYHLWAVDLDEARVRAAIDALDGYHDFHNLTPDETSTRRVVHLSVDRIDRWLVVTAQAPGFARLLVRRIVAVVRAVGAGEIEVGRIGRLLSEGAIAGHLDVAPAPPHPLVLRRVHYAGLEFRRDQVTLAAMRAWFDGVVSDAATRACQFANVPGSSPRPRSE